MGCPTFLPYPSRFVGHVVGEPVAPCPDERDPRGTSIHSHCLRKEDKVVQVSVVPPTAPRSDVTHSGMDSDDTLQASRQKGKMSTPVNVSPLRLTSSGVSLVLDMTPDRLGPRYRELVVLGPRVPGRTTVTSSDPKISWINLSETLPVTCRDPSHLSAALRS